MRICEVDASDEAEFHRYYEQMRAADLFERPHAPVWSEREAAGMFRIADDHAVWTPYAAYDGDRLVGSSFLMLSLRDNTDTAFGAVYVAPEHRGRGTGGELIEHLTRSAEQAGRSVVIVECGYPFERRDDHPYRRFVEKHGFALASTEVSRSLDLPVPESRLKEWLDEAAQVHAGYRLETYLGQLPDRLLASVCSVLNQLAVDAPSGDLEFEAEAMTPEVWRHREAKHAAMGLTMLVTVAVREDQLDEAVAATQLMLPATDEQKTDSQDPDAHKVYQWATLVTREHRGHRLGLAIKARNLLEMQRAYPERTELWTSNEEANGPMLDINIKMGFRPVELLAAFQRKLP